MEFKVNIGDPKSGRTANKVLKDDECKSLIGKRIGDTVQGEALGFAGYEFKVMGGSDNAGFPMRWDVRLAGRRKILLVEGVGLRPGKRKGVRIRKTVAGNAIYAKTAQVNLMVTKQGKEPLVAPKTENTEGSAESAEKPAKKPADSKPPAEDAKQSAEKPAKKTEQPEEAKPTESDKEKAEKAPVEATEKPKKATKKE